MIKEIKFELRRLFRGKKIFFLFLIFVLVTLSSIYSGIIEFKGTQKEKDFFIQYERKVLEKYVTYTQYGDYGFRVFFEEPFLSIYSNGVLENVSSNVDMTEILKIVKSYKGKDLFIKKGYFRDFSGLFYLLGSLFMLFMGMTSFKNENHFFRFRNVFIKLIFLIGFILLALLLMFFFPKILGIKYSGNEADNFMHSSFYLILFLSFFYSAGLFIRLLSRKKIVCISVMFIFWFFSVIVIPENLIMDLSKKAKSLPSNEKYNFVKLEEVMSFERDARKILANRQNENLEQQLTLKRKLVEQFYKNGYKKNIEKENEINAGVNSLIKNLENNSVFYPTSFYTFLSCEVSGKGYYGYLGFLEYIMKIRDNFVKFIILKKFTPNGKHIESFVKGYENIFKAQSHLPKSYWKGVGFTALYTFLLFAASYFILSRRLNKKKESLDPGFDTDEGKMYHILCKETHYMEAIFHYYELRNDVVCIDNVKGEDIDPGIDLKQMLVYFSKFKGANLERAFENIEKLGIADIEKEPHTPEAVKKIFCAVHLAIEKNIFVFKEFISREAKPFERKFLSLLKDMMENDCTIIYLDMEYPEIESPFTEKTVFERFLILPLPDPTEFILR